MRRTMTLFRTGLAGAAAVAMLSACGGGSGDDTASTSSTSSTSSQAASSTTSTSRTADPAATEFCSQVGGVFSQLQTIGTSPDLSQAPALLQQAATTVQKTEAPSDISADWEALMQPFQQLAERSQSIDLTKPDASQQLQQAATESFATVGTQLQNVVQYVTVNCQGVSASPTPTN